MKHWKVLVVTLFAAAVPLCARSGEKGGAAEWAQWRGPNRDGVSTETGLLKQWPAGGPKLEWKAPGLGGGFSSVSIAGGKIFTMGDGPDSCNLLALDLNGGKVLWSAKVGAPAGGGGYPGPRGSPTVDGGLVYAIGQYGDLVCVEIATGKERWRKSMKSDFGGAMMSGWGYAESPLVDGDNLICTPGGAKGALVALNKATGALVWQSKDFTDQAAYSSIIIGDIGGVKQYIQFTGASVVGVAVDSGSTLWCAARFGKTAVIPTPILYDSHVYVTSGYDIGCNLFKVSSAGKVFKAEEVYAKTEMQNHHGGVIRIGDYVYGTDRNMLTCMEFKTGLVKWKNPSVGKGALAYADGHLYLRSESSGGGGGRRRQGPGGQPAPAGPPAEPAKSSIALVEATPEAYKEKGRFDQPDRSNKNSWAHPVICGGKLYLRDQDVLLCYDVKAK